MLPGWSVLTSVISKWLAAQTLTNVAQTSVTIGIESNYISSYYRAVAERHYMSSLISRTYRQGILFCNRLTVILLVPAAVSCLEPCGSAQPPLQSFARAPRTEDRNEKLIEVNRSSPAGAHPDGRDGMGRQRKDLARPAIAEFGGAR